MQPAALRKGQEHVDGGPAKLSEIDLRFEVGARVRVGQRVIERDDRFEPSGGELTKSSPIGAGPANAQGLPELLRQPELCLRSGGLWRRESEQEHRAAGAEVAGDLGRRIVVVLDEHAEQFRDIIRVLVGQVEEALAVG
jgi:hypothetical protein